MLRDPASPSMDYRFRWVDRLHRAVEFRRAIREGQRFSQSGITLWVYRNGPEATQGPRMGLAIPKTYGNAVRRNRMKRLLREVFRLNKARLVPRVDMVFSARASAPDFRYQTLEPVVLELWSKAHLIDPS